MNKKGFATLAIVLIVGGIWYFSSRPPTYEPTVQSGSQTVASSSPSSTVSVWPTYNNTQFGFKIDYPNGLILSTGDGYVGPGSGQDYASGAPAFWFGTMSESDIAASPGKPDYEALIVMPTQCLKNAWGATTSTSVVVNGISMQKQSFAPGLEWFTFKGNPQYGWSLDCNTIVIRGSLDGGNNADVASIYEKMLNSFSFTQ